MAHSILILDDDVDFNSLLTDIYEQADYIVTSVTDPVEAIEVFGETDYDLVVTDHKMPEMSGSDFMMEIKRHKPQIPVIMISGYLENDMIRELIRDGVGGVFLKPLNIFSLLERTEELVEEAKRIENSPSEAVSGSGGAKSATSLGFTFRSFPCKSGASTAFAEQLHNLRNFKSTLCLIGEPGTHYRRICEDIRSFNEGSREQFIYLSAGNFDEVQTLSLIAKAQKEDARRITFVLLELEAMDDVQKELAIQLAKHEDPYDGLDIEMRTIFCLSQDLDTLFDQQQIDESLYILMGTAEVQVPPLRECQADIGIMAQQLLMEIAREKSMATVPPLEGAARDLFRQYPLKRNFEELSEITRIIIDNNQGDSISGEAVRAAIEGDRAVPLHNRLKSFLEAQQADYLRAASILCAGDRRRIAELFDTEPSTIKSKMD